MAPLKRNEKLVAKCPKCGSTVEIPGSVRTNEKVEGAEVRTRSWIGGSMFEATVSCPNRETNGGRCGAGMVWEKA